VGGELHDQRDTRMRTARRRGGRRSASSCLWCPPPSPEADCRPNPPSARPLVEKFAPCAVSVALKSALAECCVHTRRPACHPPTPRLSPSRRQCCGSPHQFRGARIGDRLRLERGPDAVAWACDRPRAPRRFPVGKPPARAAAARSRLPTPQASTASATACRARWSRGASLARLFSRVVAVTLR
jgi:hypothetical protein